MTLAYDTSQGIIAVAFRLRSTVIPTVLQKSEFYFLSALNLALFHACRVGNYSPDEYHAFMSMKLTAVTGSLMTFFIVFYNAHMYARYQELHLHTRGILENVMYICAIASKELDQKRLVQKMSRWLLASCFIFFFERIRVGENPDDGPISNDEWTQLCSLGLMEPNEVEYMQEHCKRLKSHAIPSYHLLHWSMKLYRLYSVRHGDMDRVYMTIRKCQEDVQALVGLPMPFMYYHIMNVMLIINLSLWAYGLAVLNSFFAPVIFCFVQLMFQGIRELSIQLSDPFGDDETDFPLDEWMTALYNRVYDLIEEEHDIRVIEGKPIPIVPLDAHLLSTVPQVAAPARHRRQTGARSMALPGDRGEYMKLSTGPGSQSRKLQHQQHHHHSRFSLQNIW